MMNPAPGQRPKWKVDVCLERLIGQDVRVAADAFFPVRWDGQAFEAPIPVRELILPDNSRPGVLPVFFEGRLQKFERQVAVVFVDLAPPSCPAMLTEGTVLLRGATAVLLRGPAIVRLAFPFRVERLPADEDNYWEDIRFPKAQLRLPFTCPSVVQFRHSEKSPS